MSLDLCRIESAIDCATLRNKTIAVVGVGGSATLVEALVRSGLECFRLFDFDVVGPENMTRQEYGLADIGLPKVQALEQNLYRINPDLQVHGFDLDITKLPFAKALEFVQGADLLVSSTDCFAAQSLANRLALALKTPAIWPGLYERGFGGEVIWWKLGLPCYRCLLGNRYKAQEQARHEGRKLDPASDGVTVLDSMFVDCIVGALALALLTDGSDNRYGRLISKLGLRNFLLLKIDPDYRLNGRDLVREWLRIEPDSDGYFGWCVAAKADPTLGQPPCEDCLQYGNTVCAP